MSTYDSDGYMEDARWEVERFLDRQNIPQASLTKELINDMAYHYYKNYYSYNMKLSNEAEDSVKEYLHWLVQHKPENFSNGRAMRNLFESALSSQANRLADLEDISDEELNEIAKEDLPEWVIHPRNDEECPAF